MSYMPSKTVIKGFWIFAYAGVGALTSYVTQLPPEQAGMAVPLIAAVLKMLENYIRHRKG